MARSGEVRPGGSTFTSSAVIHASSSIVVAPFPCVN
jgi:hypothetical protein